VHFRRFLKNVLTQKPHGPARVVAVISGRKSSLSAFLTSFVSHENGSFGTAASIVFPKPSIRCLKRRYRHHTDNINICDISIYRPSSKYKCKYLKNNRTVSSFLVRSRSSSFVDLPFFNFSIYDISPECTFSNILKQSLTNLQKKICETNKPANTMTTHPHRKIFIF